MRRRLQNQRNAQVLKKSGFTPRQELCFMTLKKIECKDIFIHFHARPFICALYNFPIKTAAALYFFLLPPELRFEEPSLSWSVSAFCAFHPNTHHHTSLYLLLPPSPPPRHLCLPPHLPNHLLFLQRRRNLSHSLQSDKKKCNSWT